MRQVVLGGFLTIALLGPSVAQAQVQWQPTQPPATTAADAEWYSRGEPIFFAGSYYYPTGPSVPFDGNVMVRSGVYQGVPLYANATLEPWSIVYVPTGGNFMKPYERLRAGDLAGTTGSRTPSFPVQGVRDEPTAAATGVVQPEAVGSTGTIGSATEQPSPQTPAPVATAGARPGKTMEAVPPPSRNEGIWIDFESARWYHAGPAVRFDAERHEPIGSYRGFPVYREKNAGDDVIYVSAGEGSAALTPYASKS